MDDDLFEVERVDDFRKLCISRLARQTIDEAEIHSLGSNRGYYIYEVDERPVVGGIHILAKAASLEAAFRLISIWRERPPRAA